ncbi:hypothetical protein [Paenibacillus alvei]|uniref:hypothetical protein n=1 Tax=Paenibacillus alvei TaxID=44250 RepID=UPI0018CE76CC|nr:hypothetical protein [Paenibacillus alvei]MBG9735784.1 hypothetical protein [Paenibacillus alvei]MBG9744357.1 hypothetical protein [Paenibacillus alvei]MCY9577906.1 hypothetical protein [Paenibacillus alvei]MCY9587327.1 hypothetical protein [Paenibacillus alvei]
MKPSIKCLLVATLSAASILASTSSAFADDSTAKSPIDHSNLPVIEANGNVPGLGNGGDVFTPMDSKEGPSINFNKGTTSESVPIQIQAGRPWLKVVVENTGTGNMIVTITKDHSYGQNMATLVLSPGQRDRIWGMMPSDGRYYVNFTSGSILKGWASSRVASSYQELDL